MSTSQDRIMQIALELGRKYVLLAEGAITLERLLRSMAERELFLTPEEGWPGKNEEQRKWAKRVLLNSDAAYMELATTEKIVNETNHNLAAHIQAHEAERRGIETLVRIFEAEANNLREFGAPRIEPPF